MDEEKEGDESPKPILNNEEKIEMVIARAWNLEVAYGEALKANADAEFDHRKKKANTFLESSGAMELRKVLAEKAALDELNKFLHTKATVTFLSDRLENARAVLSARQSILNAETKRRI